LLILFEDNHLIAVQKRVGDLVQGDETGDAPLSDIIKEYLKVTYDKPGAVFLGVIHRLDRPTSGIVLFAKTSKALTRMNEQFKNRETEKTYWAMVKGCPNPMAQSLVHYLKRNPKNNTSKAYPKPVDEAKEARLDFTVIKQLDHYSCLEVYLHTGRHHQIRSQLAAIGFPIKGDLKYGADRSNPDGGISLHAVRLIFTHPVTKEHIQLEAKPDHDALWREVVLLGR